jgi:WD40 repeat protein
MVLRHQVGQSCCCALPEGRLASGGEDGVITIWDTTSGAKLAVLRHYEGAWCAIALPPAGASSIAWMPDRSLLAVAHEDGAIRLWDVASRTLLGSIEGPELEYAGWLVALPGGRLALSAQDSSGICIYNTHTLTLERMLAGHEGCVNQMALLPSGLLASGSVDHTVRLWDWEAGECRHVLRAHAKDVRALCVTSDGRIFTASDDMSVREWCFMPDQAWSCLMTWQLQPGPGVRRLVTLPSDNIAGVTWGPIAEVTLPLQPGFEPLRGHVGWAYGIAALPDGRVATAANDTTVIVWGDDALQQAAWAAKLAAARLERLTHTSAPQQQRRPAGGMASSVDLFGPAAARSHVVVPEPASASPGGGAGASAVVGAGCRDLDHAASATTQSEAGVASGDLP